MNPGTYGVKARHAWHQQMFGPTDSAPARAAREGRPAALMKLRVDPDRRSLWALERAGGREKAREPRLGDLPALSPSRTLSEVSKPLAAY